VYAGHEVLLVGGAVRDLLLQRGEPKDYDILTSAQLKQVCSSADMIPLAACCCSSFRTLQHLR
jgi:tRNA nucleotidyltransferase/poly(A) polymerase